MTKRDRLMLMGVLAVALLGAFWMLVLKPQRQAAADATAQVQAAQSALDEARTKLNAGRKAQQEFRRDRTTIVKLGRVVPETDDIPTLLTQLQDLAAKEKVKFNSYEVSSNPGSASGSDSTSTETTTDQTGDQAGTGSTAAIAPLFPPGSVEIDGGLGRTPISLEFEGSYFQLERYLRAVQRFAVLSQKSSKTTGRLMIVDGFAYEAAEPDDAGVNGEKAKTAAAWSKQPKLKASLSASVYFAPPLELPSAGSASGGSTAPSTPAPSGSTSTGTAAIGGVQ